MLHILYCYHQSNEEPEMKGGKKFSIIALNSSVPAAWLLTLNYNPLHSHSIITDCIRSD